MGRPAGLWFLSGWLVESLSLPAVAMPHFILRERQTVGESSAVFPSCADTQAVSALAACQQGFKSEGHCEMASLQSHLKEKQDCLQPNPSILLYIKPAIWRNHSFNLVFFHSICSGLQSYHTVIQTSGRASICNHTHVFDTNGLTFNYANGNSYIYLHNALASRLCTALQPLPMNDNLCDDLQHASEKNRDRCNLLGMNDAQTWRSKCGHNCMWTWTPSFLRGNMKIPRVTEPARDPVRQIDWRKEAGDANLCKEFGVAAHNRSKTLCDKLEDKNSSAVYCKQRCNTGVAPKKSEMMLTYASNEMVTRAKQDLKLAAQKHQSGPARNFCNDANIQKSNREPPQTLQSLCCKRNAMFNRLRSLTTSATQYCLTEFPFILNLLKLQIICRFADCFSVPAVPVRG